MALFEGIGSELSVSVASGEPLGVRLEADGGDGMLIKGTPKVRLNP